MEAEKKIFAEHLEKTTNQERERIAEKARKDEKTAIQKQRILDGMKRIMGLCDDDLDRDWEEPISFCTVVNWLRA